MKTKLLLSGLWVIVSLMAMFCNPSELASFGIMPYFGYFAFWTANAIYATNKVNKYIHQ